MSMISTTKVSPGSAPSIYRGPVVGLVILARALQVSTSTVSPGFTFAMGGVRGSRTESRRASSSSSGFFLILLVIRLIHSCSRVRALKHFPEERVE
jgi:hypothetical protein